MQENVISVKMEKDEDQVGLQKNYKYNIDQLIKLKSSAEVHMRFSRIYLRMLRGMSHPRETKNVFPWKTVKEGSYYLGNVYHLVQTYKNIAPDWIDDKYMRTLNRTLVELEFHPDHISSGYTDEAYSGLAECFVSKGQGTTYYNLLHSQLAEDVRSFIKLVEFEIDVPVTKFLDSVNKRLQSEFFECLIEAIKDYNLVSIGKCIQRGVVNFKDESGWTPLHWAVSGNKVDAINILIKYGAEITQTTHDGNTSLHLASSKGYLEVVQLLLHYVDREQFNDFINAATTDSSSSPLHIASTNGCFDIVKSLLKHGALYNIKNKSGKAPIDVSNHEIIVNFLRLVDDIFQGAKEGNVEVINKLETVNQDEFSAILNTRNSQGKTLIQFAVLNGYKNIASEFFKLIKQQRHVSLPSIRSNLDLLEKLRFATEAHIRFTESDLWLSFLRDFEYGEYISPWEKLQIVSYFFNSAYRIVKMYHNWETALTNDINIVTVKNALNSLGFHPEDIKTEYTNEAFGGRAQCFASKGRGKKYYNLLLSNSDRDTYTVFNQIEEKITIPINKFCSLYNSKLQSPPYEPLPMDVNMSLPSMDDVKKTTNRDSSNPKDAVRKTILHHASGENNIDIISTLLKDGFSVSQTSNEGDTALHIASSKGYCEVVELLLQFKKHAQFEDFINIENVVGDTSVHLAAKNGFLDVVKSLLKHGAIYNIQNKNGQTPLNSTNFQKVVDFLQLVDDVFQNAKDGNIEIIDKLKTQNQDAFLTIVNARNNEGKTLLQISVANDNKSFTRKLLAMLY